VYRPSADPRVADALRDPDTGVASWRTVGPTVWLLGLTSLVTDISSEMVTAVLPAYLVIHLGLSPAAVGVLDGLYQGGASLVRIVGGAVTDRWRLYREAAFAGYLVSAVSKLGFLLAGANAVGVGAVVLADRFGKGVRTAPRDALISLSAPRQSLAAAFGVHRALDMVGAMLGPVVAFLVLRVTARAYDAVFVVSLALGLVGAAILLAFVRNPRARLDPRAAPTDSFVRTLAGRGPRRLAVLSGALGLVTLSDGLVYLVLQRRTGLDATLIPLLFVATPAAYAACALPLGILADRVGRGRVVVGGYLALMAAYLLLATTQDGAEWPLVAACVVLLGCHHAASDGVLPALASVVWPDESRATGIAVVGTCHDVGRVMASTTFGVLWAAAGMATAVGAMAGALAGVLAVAGVSVTRLESHR
jgi:MFS family permease